MSLTLAVYNSAATTAFYPLNGRGDKTTTAADSLVVDASVTVMQALTVTGGVAWVYHDADKVSGTRIAAVMDGAVNSVLDCGPDGIELIGNWYVEVAGTGVELTLVFQQGQTR